MVYRDEVNKPEYEKDSLGILVTFKKNPKQYGLFRTADNIPLKLKLSPEESVEDDVLEVKNYIELWKDVNFSRIFLCGNDIFKLNYKRLCHIANLINIYFPNLKSIGCICKVKDIQEKTNDQLKNLRKIGYDKLTVEMKLSESKILKYMKNGYESDEIVEECERLDNANIKYNIFYKEGNFEKEEKYMEKKLVNDIFKELHPINIMK